jgi:MerR family mercuric resistance operon transcriptional regulator
MDEWTISALAREGGVNVETVRYYQRRGLLAEPARGSGIRRYGRDDLRRLRFVRGAQAAGFTLDEIARLLALDATEDRAVVHTLAEQRIAALDERIATLTEAREALRRLAHQCGSGSRGPCPILGAFEGNASNP